MQTDLPPPPPPPPPRRRLPLPLGPDFAIADLDRFLAWTFPDPQTRKRNADDLFSAIRERAVFDTICAASLDDALRHSDL